RVVDRDAGAAAVGVGVRAYLRRPSRNSRSRSNAGLMPPRASTSPPWGIRCVSASDRWSQNTPETNDLQRASDANVDAQSAWACGEKSRQRPAPAASSSVSALGSVAPADGY